ncbi:hypothetical protein AVBRAN12640_09105 [Campylobacter sp. RM12640]|uniref:hypothetical protein n=1 Tax=unclassified Campylobacter TaxID=2593542 RepID=UPI00301429DE|nr:hypothetical protein [Campylobacter sp. RM12640]MBZ7989945.1 hypothetical protein [Campylobacter sp. RM12635]
MILRSLRKIIKLDDYELIFTELKRLDYVPYLLYLNEEFGTKGLSYEELRLFGYRKLTLPECKSALDKALTKMIMTTYKAYK